MTMTNATNATITLQAVYGKATTLGGDEQKGSLARFDLAYCIADAANMGVVKVEHVETIWDKFCIARHKADRLKNDPKGANFVRGEDFKQRVSGLRTIVAVASHPDIDFTRAFSAARPVIDASSYAGKQFEALYRLCCAMKKVWRALTSEELAALFADKPKAEEAAPVAKTEAEMLQAALDTLEKTVKGSKATAANGMVGRDPYPSAEADACIRIIKLRLAALDVKASDVAMAA
jgi:hypothetical protein